MDSNSKLERARRLLLRAVDLVNSGEEYGSQAVASSSEAMLSSLPFVQSPAGVRPVQQRPSGSTITSTVGQLPIYVNTGTMTLTGSQLQSPVSYVGGTVTTPNANQSYNQPGPSSYSDQLCDREHHRLFGFKSRVSSNGSMGQKQLARGRKRSAGVTEEPFHKKKVWTRDCICLGYHDQEIIPTPEEKMTLAAAGLGLKRLTFLQTGNDAHIRQVIQEAYPKLQESGQSFVLMRPSSSSTRSLMIIKPPLNGYTIPYLRDVINQAKIYIRPMEKDIEDIEKVKL